MFSEANSFDSDMSGWSVSSAIDLRISCYSSYYYFQIIYNTVYALSILTYIIHLITVRIRLIMQLWKD